jgi:hypothetical protein
VSKGVEMVVVVMVGKEDLVTEAVLGEVMDLVEG